MPGLSAAGQFAGRHLPRVAGDRTARRGGAFAPDDIAATPASLQIAWGLAANAVATWIVRGELPHLEGKVQTLDPTTWKTESHTLVRLPFCPACGAGEAGDEPDRPADRS